MRTTGLDGYELERQLDKRDEQREAPSPQPRRRSGPRPEFIIHVRIDEPKTSSSGGDE